MPDGAAVYCIERLFFLEDTLIANEYAYIPLSLFPMLTAGDVQHNFYTFAEQQLHEKICIATQQITAASATADEQRRLAIEEGAPVLRMHRITKLLSGKPIELMRRTYRADCYTLTTTIVR